MAVIKYGSIVTGGSGSLGGSTLQPCHSGNIWRNKPQQTYSRTPAQAIIRGYNKTMQAGWRALTDQARQVWNNFAQLHPVCNRAGEKHPLSGHSLWLKYQYYQLACNLPLLTSPYEYVDVSSYCQAAQCYILRVLADGGQVMDMQLTDNLFRHLITLSAEDVFISGFFPYGGVKLRDDAGALYVVKWYNFFNDNDLVQATPANQFRYALNSIGSIPVLTSNLSKMYFAPNIPLSYILVNGWTGSVTAGFISLSSQYIGPGIAGLRYRGPIAYGYNALINKIYRVDAVIVTSPTVNVWRNNVASVDNPQPGYAANMDGIGARSFTNYWNGYYGGIISSLELISTTIRESLTTFLMNQFSIT